MLERNDRLMPEDESQDDASAAGSAGARGQVLRELVETERKHVQDLEALQVSACLKNRIRAQAGGQADGMRAMRPSAPCIQPQRRSSTSETRVLTCGCAAYEKQTCRGRTNFTRHNCQDLLESRLDCRLFAQTSHRHREATHPTARTTTVWLAFCQMGAQGRYSPSQGSC